MTKTWESPKLIVLVRNNPQEAVLDYCKGTPNLLAAIFPNSDYSSCSEYPFLATTPACQACSSVNAS